MEFFDSFEAFKNFCFRWYDKDNKVFEDTSVFEEKENGKIVFNRAKADEKYLPKEECNKLYWPEGQCWKEFEGGGDPVKVLEEIQERENSGFGR